jgi:hypothetical protein
VDPTLQGGIVTVRTPPLASFLLALLLALAAPAARAQNAPAPGTPARPHTGIVGVDAMTSTVFQEGQSSFSGLALRLRIKSPSLVRNIDLMPTFEYWQNTNKLDAFDIRTTRRDAALGLDARWLFEHAGWQPYAGAGFALHFLDSEVRAPRVGVPHGTDALIKGGVNVLGGVDFAMNERLGSFLELKLMSVVKYRQVKFNTGLNFNF